MEGGRVQQSTLKRFSWPFTGLHSVRLRKKIKKLSNLWAVFNPVSPRKLVFVGSVCQQNIYLLLLLKNYLLKKSAITEIKGNRFTKNTGNQGYNLRKFIVRATLDGFWKNTTVLKNVVTFRRYCKKMAGILFLKIFQQNRRKIRIGSLLKSKLFEAGNLRAFVLRPQSF